MTIEDQIAAAKLKAIDDWDAGHKNCDFGSKERAGGMRDGFGDGFEVGYLAALRSLFFEVKPEDLIKIELYHVAFVENGSLVWRKNVMVSLSRPYLLCWIGSKGWDWEYAERSAAVRAFKMATTNLPSPSDLFTEH